MMLNKLSLASAPLIVFALLAPLQVSASFTRDLQRGSVGGDVKELQIFLNSKGFVVASSGPGSTGQETEQFGTATEAALKKFQASAGILSSGYFGPKTRSYATSITLPEPLSSQSSAKSLNISESAYTKLKAELFNEFKSLLIKQSDANMNAASKSINSVHDSVDSLSNSISGIASSPWVSNLDGSISYNSGNVGVGATVFSPAISEPVCDASKRGYIVRVEGGDGVADTYRQCIKGADDAYSWSSFGGGSAGKLTATFLFCAGSCTVTETANWSWDGPCGGVTGTACTTPVPITFVACSIRAVTYPVGAPITVDITKNGTTASIFGSNPVLTLADGSNTISYAAPTGTAASLTSGDTLTATMTGVGSTVPGQFINVVCTATY